MDQSIKTKIYQLLDSIEDETILNQVMEEVTFLATKTDPVENLNSVQLMELETAIAEANKNETIPWDDFKKQMDEWKAM